MRIVKKGEIQNHFLELLQLLQGDALTIFETIIDFFGKNDVDLKRTRFAGMDGCTVMAREHNDLDWKKLYLTSYICIVINIVLHYVSHIWFHSSKNLKALMDFKLNLKFVFIIEEQQRETSHIWRSTVGIQFVIPRVDKSSVYLLVRSWSSRARSFRLIRGIGCCPWCNLSAQTRTSSTRSTRRLD